MKKGFIIAAFYIAFSFNAAYAAPTVTSDNQVEVKTQEKLGQSKDSSFDSVAL